MMTNPVWIIDDDRSIRWVLEKALGRENIPVKSFATADEALRALADALLVAVARRRVVRTKRRVAAAPPPSLPSGSLEPSDHAESARWSEQVVVADCPCE